MNSISEIEAALGSFDRIDEPIAEHDILGTLRSMERVLMPVSPSAIHSKRRFSRLPC